jgi:hypothetical protein
MSEAKMCLGGASSGETSAANEQSQLAQSLNSAFQTTFGENQEILGGLTSALTPIVAAGPGQQGFTPSELSSLDTSAMDTTAAAYKNAATAAAERGASANGVALPSGAQEQVQAGIGETAAQQESSELANINEENYSTGRQNFFNAENALGGVASEESPTSYASEAENATSGEFGEQQQLQKQNSAWEGDLLGTLTGLGTTALEMNPADMFG